MTNRPDPAADPAAVATEPAASDTPDTPDGPASAAPAAPAVPAHDPETTPWSGRSAWVFPAVVAAFGAIAVWGALTIQAPPNSAPPGPGVVPGVIGVLLLLTAGWMAAVNVRVDRARRAGVPLATAPPADWPPVGIVVLTLAVHVALLEPLGWLLAGALLFWGVAYAFGARDHLRDALVSLSMSAAVQVGFSFGLGLNLPGGVLELVL